MSDLISRELLIGHLNECLAESDGQTPIVDAVLTAIKCAVEQMPTVDAVPTESEFKRIAIQRGYVQIDSTYKLASVGRQ